MQTAEKVFFYYLQLLGNQSAGFFHYSRYKTNKKCKNMTKYIKKNARHFNISHYYSHAISSATIVRIKNVWYAFEFVVYVMALFTVCVRSWMRHKKRYMHVRVCICSMYYENVWTIAKMYLFSVRENCKY
jgi:hypothetical protein